MSGLFRFIIILSLFFRYALGELPLLETALTYPNGRLSKRSSGVGGQQERVAIALVRVDIWAEGMWTFILPLYALASIHVESRNSRNQGLEKTKDGDVCIACLLSRGGTWK